MFKRIILGVAALSLAIAPASAQMSFTNPGATSSSTLGGTVVCQSAAAVAVTGTTSETTTDTCTISAAAIGANGRVEIDALFSYPTNANTKTTRIKFGGTTYASLAATTTTGIRYQVALGNRNATNSQVGNANLFPIGGTVTTSSVVTSAVDTTASVTLLLTCQLGVGTDTCTREAFKVIIYPKA